MFSAVVFFVLVWAIMLAALVVYLLIHFGVIGGLQDAGLVSIVLTLTLISAFIGTTISIFVLRIPLKPVNRWINGMNRLAEGDFRVRMRFGKPLADHPAFVELSDSFNKLAEELESTEVLRGDFINNFSHEFKTPIVSIQGFAHQLQAGGLTPEEEREYIRIIATESDRLAKMATNILLLSKLENQAIVTDKTEFYLDEQIRTCLLLLEKQWDAKNIDLNLDLDEVKYHFNETMLSHVWVNLLGNAIKFTPAGGCITCALKNNSTAVTVTISDTGCGMDESTQKHIFEKFYQGDTSHTGDGNGIGLTIVGRILVLCGGRIDVQSKPDAGSTFTVTLPVTVTVPQYEDVEKYADE